MWNSTQINPSVSFLLLLLVFFIRIFSLFVWTTITCVFTLALFSWFYFIVSFLFFDYRSLFNSHSGCFFPSFSFSVVVIIGLAFISGLILIPSLMCIWFWCYYILGAVLTDERLRKTTFKMRAHQILVLQWLQPILTWIFQACNSTWSALSVHSTLHIYKHRLKVNTSIAACKCISTLAMQFFFYSSTRSHFSDYYTTINTWRVET